MNIPTLKTQNLNLRAFNEKDSAAMTLILQGEDVLRYFPNSSPPSQEKVSKMIHNLLHHWDEYGYGLWAVESRADGELLGRSGLQYIQETAEVEVDFILGNKFWGRGYATEAGRASLQYGFENLDLDIIVGIVHQENAASQRVLEKIGLHFTEAKAYFGMACYRYVIDKEISRWANT